MARKQALARARGGIRALGPLALASLKAQRCALKRIQSRERAPAFARTTAGVSGQCGGILSSDGGLPGAFEPLALAGLRPAPLAALKAQRCVLKRIQSRERAPAFARTTAGVSGQCGGILSSDGGLPGAFEPLALAGLRPAPLAALKAQRCALKRIQSRERRPSIAKATAGVSGQCGGILSSDGGLPGAFEPLALAGLRPAPLAALKAQRCVVKQCQ
jgi:hypothetical protein